MNTSQVWNSLMNGFNVIFLFWADTWPLYNPKTMEFMNLTVESDYTRRSARRIGTGPRRKQCQFWKHIVPKLLSVSGGW